MGGQSITNLANITLNEGNTILINSSATDAAFRDIGTALNPTNADAGDFYYNTTSNRYVFFNGIDWNEIGGGVIQTQLSADATETAITGTTLTQVKDMSFIKGVINWQFLTIEIDMKTDNAGTTAHCRVRHDGLGTDDLDLTTISTSYEVLSGIIDISLFSAGRHTLEFLIEDGVGDTVTLRETWVFGME